MKIFRAETFLAYISVLLSMVTTGWWINGMVFDDRSVIGYMDWLILSVAVSFTFILTLLTYGLKRHLGNQIVFGLEAKFIYGSCFGFLLVLIMSIAYTN